MAQFAYQPRKVVFAFEVAGECPSRAEIANGIVLHDAILSGWETRTTSRDVSDGSSRFPKTVPGRGCRLAIRRSRVPVKGPSSKAP
jgi:hypothetical protein